VVLGRMRKVDREAGFSLIELLATMVLLGILLTLGAFALKNFWMRRSLDGSTKQVTAQLRQMQQRAVAESHPLIYGAGFTEGSPTYTLLKYDPAATLSKCETLTTVALEDGVKVGAGTSFESSPYIALSECDPASGDQFVFFFARGTATKGELNLIHEGLAGSSQDTTTISVTNLTGRVEGGY
jgi:prepilin-type N-terminal cleavage/methylation domain-containing protein